uniref:Uncharacterized protein n=1 Tax=Rhizophora mucronata TaxID=61149 RepID=A0A2P2P2Y9_RHIMU
MAISSRRRELSFQTSSPHFQLHQHRKPASPL